jgi:hypothetical protein
MLAPTTKNKRFYSIVQFALSFASTCAVIEASGMHAAAEQRTGYYASVPLHSERSGDRRVGDLARAERKRREAQQQSNRRGIEVQQSELAAGATNLLRALSS